MNAPLPEHIRKALETVTLDDKYSLDHGRAFMSGVQALVKLPMLQRLRDQHAGQEHGGLHQRLPRLAAGRLRPGAVEGRAVPEGAEHRVPARRERRTGRHRPVGHAAAGLCAARHQQVRRRVRHLVRQGPGRGPLLRRVQARQHGRHHALGRRDRGGGGRPYLQELDRRAPERPHLQGLRHAGVLPGQRAGDPGPGHPRVCHEPLLRRLVRHEDDPGDRRVQRHGDDRPRARADPASRPISRCRPAACTSAGPTMRWTRKRACSTTSGTPRWPTSAPTG